MALQRRRSRIGVLVVVAGVGLLLTPAPPQLGFAVVLVAVVLVVGGSTSRA